MPGIRRIKHRRTFAYVATDGRPVRDRAELARIAALAVPPAYTDVWISPIGNGHLQATGRDARGRKQYRYHQRWRAVRDETKFDRMVDFAKALPAIRATVAVDMGLPGLPREKFWRRSFRCSKKRRSGSERGIRARQRFVRPDDARGRARRRHADESSVSFRGKSGRCRR